jgi:hypothetical protein
VQEVILAEEQAHGLHPLMGVTNWWNWRRPAHMHGINDEFSSGGIDDSWSHFEVPVRSTGLRCRSVGLSLGRPPRPLLQVVHPVVFLFLLSFAPRRNYNIHFHTHTQIYIRILENLCYYTPEPPYPRSQ